jgi:transcriptional regulator with XRE-family HTH domain
MSAVEIGQIVQLRRKQLRLRQRDLAEMAGVTLRGLTNLESGTANPTLSVLSRIAEVLGLELSLRVKSLHASS